MRSYNIKNQGTTSLFQNRLLEALTRTHFAFPVTLYSILSLAIIVYSAVGTDLVIWKILYLFPAGLLTFSMVEYFIHRFVFHFHAENEKQEMIKYKMHGVHHEFPKDKDRLAMPPLISIVLALFFYGLFRFILGNDVLLFFPGFLMGYVIYLTIHYSVHRFHPPKNFLKILWTHHAIHHYKSEEAAFGVSFPFWDYVFGTMPASKKTSTTES